MTNNASLCLFGGEETWNGLTFQEMIQKNPENEGMFLVSFLILEKMLNGRNLDVLVHIYVQRVAPRAKLVNFDLQFSFFDDIQYHRGSFFSD